MLWILALILLSTCRHSPRHDSKTNRITGGKGMTIDSVKDGPIKIRIEPVVVKGFERSDRKCKIMSGSSFFGRQIPLQKKLKISATGRH